MHARRKKSYDPRTFVYFDPFSSILLPFACFGTNYIFVSMLNFVVTPCVMLITFACSAECSSTFTKVFYWPSCSSPVFIHTHTLDTWILRHTRTHTNISTHTPHRNRLAHHALALTSTHTNPLTHARTHTHTHTHACNMHSHRQTHTWYGILHVHTHINTTTSNTTMMSTHIHVHGCVYVCMHGVCVCVCVCVCGVRTGMHIYQQRWWQRYIIPLFHVLFTIW